MDSAQQICVDACAIAKAAGFVTYAGRFLQATLNDLAIHRNLKQLLTSTSVALSGASNGPFNLPLNYRRPYDFFYSVNGEPYEIVQFSLEDYDREFKDQSVANYPSRFATDESGMTANPATAPLLYVYPQSSIALTATLRYFLKVTEMNAPLETNANVPWFEDQEYLRCDVARQLMAITDDERFPLWDGPEGVVERLLRKHLLMEGDEQKVLKRIRLDPLTFRSPRKVRPTKATVW